MALPPSDHLGTKIRIARRLRDWTQDHLAGLVDARQSQISNIENGHPHGLSPEQVIRITDLLEVGSGTHMPALGSTLVVYCPQPDCPTQEYFVHLDRLRILPLFLVTAGKYCSLCGTPYVDARCRKCGADIEGQGGAFCIHCKALHVDPTAINEQLAVPNLWEWVDKRNARNREIRAMTRLQIQDTAIHLAYSQTSKEVGGKQGLPAK